MLFNSSVNPAFTGVQSVTLDPSRPYGLAGPKGMV